MKFRWRKGYTNGIIVMAIVSALIYAAAQVEVTTLGDVQVVAQAAKSPSPVKMEPGLDELPLEPNFKPMAETASLVLLADSSTGHFIVKDKRNDRVYRSYPDPQQWEQEPQQGSWRYHLRSPLMLEYMDFAVSNSRAQLTSFVAQAGAIEQFQAIEGGFSLTFRMPNIGITVPVRVTIKDDYVQTTIVDDGLTEEIPRLIWLQLYPFFGAEQSAADKQGYMLIPDGSGALITFKNREFASNQIYNQRVYGEDIAFSVNTDSADMKKASFPVFGMKSGDRSFVAILGEGSEYAAIKASPAGVYSHYNWITVQHNYRETFKMIPDRSNPQKSFITYNVDSRFDGDRTIRYYLLNQGDNGYVEMAAKYREYLMQTSGLTKLEAKKELPLDLSIIGNGTQYGFMNTRTVNATSTSQAMQILQRLYGLGVGKMTVSYWGWQNGGYDRVGGNFPVDGWLGGNKGMKEFVNFAHSLDIPVYLKIEYAYNSTGDGGFAARSHGLRDLSGTLLKFGDEALVGIKFAEKSLVRDLPKYQALGIDGLELQTTGRYLNSDYNAKYGGTRSEAIKIQQDMLAAIKRTLGGVRGENVNAYALGSIRHITDLPVDYSYNLFSDRSVPFVQIALHGLVQYTSDFINDHERYEADTLKDIEYGYNPSFILAWDPSKLVYTYSLWDLYSTKFADWEEDIVNQYQRYNLALGSVQDQFIVGHRELAPEVFLTEYENGHTIIVNYTDKPYSYGQLTVPAMDFAVMKGVD